MFLYVELRRMYKKIGLVKKLYIEISEKYFQIFEKIKRIHFLEQNISIFSPAAPFKHHKELK